MFAQAKTSDEGITTAVDVAMQEIEDAEAGVNENMSEYTTEDESLLE